MLTLGHHRKCHPQYAGTLRLVPASAGSKLRQFRVMHRFVPPIRSDNDNLNMSIIHQFDAIQFRYLDNESII